MPFLLTDHLFQNLMIVIAGGVKYCVVALKVSPYFIMVQIIFSGPLGFMSLRLFVLNEQILFKVILWKYSIQSLKTADSQIRKIAICFLWLSLPGDCRVTDKALLAETT